MAIKIPIDQVIYFYKIISIDRIVDGDTIDVTVDLGFHIYHKIRVRLAGYDAPEIYGRAAKTEHEAGIKVTEYLKDILDKYENNDFYILTKKTGKYGRYIGYIYVLVDDKFVYINELVENFSDSVREEYNLPKDKY